MMCYQLPVESSSFETVICICRSVEFPTDQLFEEILRVLKPGGTILVHKNPKSTVGETDKITSALERKLLLAGFLEVVVLKSTVPSEGQSFGSCSNSRTAVGLDLDLGALNWCLLKNISTVGADGYSRISLFHGNGLQPLEAKLVNFEPQ
uniref:Anamorsin N-terminal domain-containing protein n=1 Tax=Quercus lobata TaxID=97700 RepID=A0A7N2KS10_QUELO